MQEKTTQEKIRELSLLTEEQLDWVSGGDSTKGGANGGDTGAGEGHGKDNGDGKGGLK
jgi:hypothetical protein